jgi:hypothetical protein
MLMEVVFQLFGCWLLRTLAAAPLGCTGFGVGHGWYCRCCWCHPQKWRRVVAWDGIAARGFVAVGGCWWYRLSWARGLFDWCCAAVVIVLTICSIKKDVGQGVQDSDFAVCKRRESGSRRWVEQGLDDVVCARNDNVCGRCNGHGHVLWEPSYGVCEAFSMCVPHPDVVAAVAVHGQSNVPAVKGMWCPTCPFVRLFVYKDTNAWWGDGCAVKVVLAVGLGPGGELVWVDLRTSHEVESQRGGESRGMCCTGLQ